MKTSKIFVNLSDLTCVQYKYIVYFYENSKFVSAVYAKDHKEAEIISNGV